MTQDPFSELQDAYAALDQKLKTFGARDSAVEKIAQQLETATRHMQAGAFAEAASAFERVAQLAADAGQTEIQAQARYSQGGMLAALPDRRPEATVAFGQAASLFARSDNPKMAKQTERQLEALQNLTTDVGDLNEEIEAFTEQTLPSHRIKRYGQRGRRYLQAGQFQPAMLDFEAAFEIAQQSANPDLIALALNQLQFSDDEGGQDIFSSVLESLNQQASAHEDGVFQPMLSELQPQLEHLLNLPGELLGDIDLSTLLRLEQGVEAAQQLQSRMTSSTHQLRNLPLFTAFTAFSAFQAVTEALSQEHFQQALDLADAERQKALKASDRERYLRFTLACILMFQAYEGLGDFPAVIEVLLYGKATLEHARGKAAGQPFLDLLNTLEKRWGKTSLLQARSVYREHMKRQGYYRLALKPNA